MIALDDSLAAVATTTAGTGTGEIATDPVRNRLYVVNAGAGVAMFDAGSLEQLAEWTTNPGLDFVAVDSPAGLVYVSHPIGRRVFVLAAHDLSPREVIGDDTFTGAMGLAVDPELGRIYVTRSHHDGPPGSEVDALTAIQRRPDGRHEIGRTIPLGSMVQPWRVAVDPVAGLVYLLGLGRGTVAPQLIVLDRATLTERGRVPTLSGLTPSRALATRDGTGLVYVTGDAGVQVVDAESMAVVGFVPAAGASCVSAGGIEPVVSASALGTLVRMRAPDQITTTEWR
jgi:DNA-binding beta-propeller fold protein YncE